MLVGGRCMRPVCRCPPDEDAARPRPGEAEPRILGRQPAMHCIAPAARLRRYARAFRCGRQGARIRLSTSISCPSRTSCRLRLVSAPGFFLTDVPGKCLSTVSTRAPPNRVQCASRMPGWWKPCCEICQAPCKPFPSGMKAIDRIPPSESFYQYSVTNCIPQCGLPKSSWNSS